jgi:hypothetical protein
MTINTRLEKLERGRPVKQVEILLYWHGEDNQTIDGQPIPKAPGGIQLRWADNGILEDKELYD